MISRSEAAMGDVVDARRSCGLRGSAVRSFGDGLSWDPREAEGLLTAFPGRRGGARPSGEQSAGFACVSGGLAGQARRDRSGRFGARTGINPETAAMRRVSDRVASRRCYDRRSSIARARANRMNTTGLRVDAVVSGVQPSVIMVGPVGRARPIGSLVDLD